MSNTVFRITMSLILFICFQSPSWAQGSAAAYDPGMHGQQKKAYAYYIRGQELESQGDVNSAIEAYKKSVGCWPKIKEVHHTLAKAYARTGNNQKAHAAFRTALNIDSNYVECRNNFGMFLKKTDNLPDAMNQFKQCIMINKKYPYAYFNLGQMLQEKGDLAGAIDNYETATRLKPDFAEAQEALGLAVFERASQGDLSEALDKLTVAERLLPKNPKIHYHLGIIHCTRSDLDRAETQFRAALMCDPRMAAAHFQLGKLRYYRGDLDRALSELQYAQAVNQTYNESQGYPNLDIIKVKTLEAKAHEYKGDLIKALETYQQLVAMRKSDALYAVHIKELDKQIKAEIKTRKKKPLPYDPEEVDAFITKGISAYEDGDLDAARASFERALELNPQSFRATQNLCFVQEAQGDLNGAMETAQKAMALNPKYSGAVYNMAYLLEKVNLPDDAARMYENFRTSGDVYPYDPQHIIALQQNIIREQKKQEFIRKRGY
jgi:protein O-GlcNAc transferase